MPALLAFASPYITASTITLSDIIFTSVVTHFTLKAADSILKRSKQ